MPISAGEHAEVLRAVGRLLDAEFAEGVELVNNDEFLMLSWKRKGLGSDQRHYREQNLEELRRVAQTSRGTYRDEPKDSFGELFRTLGQDLDREKWKLTQIVQTPEGLQVTGIARGQYLEQLYTIAELVASSRRRREWRRGPPVTIHDTGSKFESQVSLKPGERPRSESWGATEDNGPLSRRLNKIQ